jgi:hypothetical protein
MSNRSWNFVGDLKENGTKVITDAKGTISEVASADTPSITVTSADGTISIDSSVPLRILEFKSYLNFPSVGQYGKLYIDTTTNSIYRWNDDDLKYYSLGMSLDNIKEINGGTSIT